MSQGPRFENSLQDNASADRIASAARDVNIYEATQKLRRAATRGMRLFGVVPLVVADFVPRQTLMEAIAGADVSIVTAVHGIGGVGKSQLAAKYFNDQQHQFDYAAWVDMRERRGRTTYEMIATMLDLPTSGSVDLVEAARNHIKGSSDSWLLVFDNCDHPSHLEPLLPQSPDAKIIVTSRYRHWAGYATSVAVDVFDIDTAVRYLCERARQAPSQDARDLAKGLGCLPLALSLSGSYCLRQQLDFRSYHERLGSNVTVALASSDPTKTDQAVRNLWEQSLTAAVAVDSSARALMELLCVLDWTDIGRDWLSEHYRDPNLGVLFEYSLIELTPSQISVRHNLIADGIASNLVDRPRLQETLIEVFQGSITTPGADINTAENLSEPVRHLEQLTKNHPHLVTPGLMPILSQAVWQLQEQGAVKTDFAETVHQLARTLNGPDHPGTLSAALRLAATYWSAGDYQRAVDIEEPTLTNCERVLGPDHPQTLMARNNLAASYAKIRRYDEALELGERALADRHRVLGPNNIQTLNSRNNLANRYAAVGRYNDALRLDEQTLAMRRSILGETHPDTLMSQNNLAASYAAAGRHKDALRLDQDTHLQSERVLGPNHPDTLTSQHNLSIRYVSLNRLDVGTELARKVLEDRERVLGYDHPDTSITRKVVDIVGAIRRPEEIGKTSASKDVGAALLEFNRRLESLGLEELV